MKQSIAFLAFWLLLGTAQPMEAACPEDCGFSKMNARHITHFVDRAVVSKVEPQYPPDAEAKGISSTVLVRVLINKEGRVERTCPVYEGKEPKPDRSFVIMAEAAALQWKFKANFALEPGGDIRFDYAWDIIVFKFESKGPEQNQPTPENRRGGSVPTIDRKDGSVHLTIPVVATTKPRQ